MLALALAILVQVSGYNDSTARAESLLASGEVRSALALASAITRRHPNDAGAHLLLGRVQYARPVIGRYAALDEFRTAARLAPTDPEPWYWQTMVGFYLRSDDGEWIAREALLALFAIDPDYKDAWARFHDVFHNAVICRRAERALARHGDNPVALEHRAEMRMALGDVHGADSLLRRAATRRPPTARAYLLRTEAAFLAGQAGAAYAWHDSALALADVDSTDVLWDEAWIIASPAEVARHAALAPGERRAFYERFWAQRDPDLLTPQNERLAEHYARLADSRRTYRLLHPQRTEYHSDIARALALVDWAGGLGTGDERALQETAIPQAFRASLTAEGLVYVRHGKPDEQAICVSDLVHGSNTIGSKGCASFRDEESWVYHTPEGPLGIRFGGGEYFRPISAEQARNASLLLRSDRTTLPAPLVVRAWMAAFRSSQPGLTDVYYKANGDSVALALWSADGVGVQRTGGTGLLRLTAAPGRYDLGLDADSAGQLGRIRGSTRVPFFGTGTLSLSSLALAPLTAGPASPDREQTLRAMPVDLTYRAGVPLAAYLEVYGLTLAPDNHSHYHVRYSFAPLRSGLARVLGIGRAATPVVFEFDRVADSSHATEQLVIEPDRVPAGRYRVTVAVTDRTRNVKSESVALDIDIR